MHTPGAASCSYLRARKACTGAPRSCTLVHLSAPRGQACPLFPRGSPGEISPLQCGRSGCVVPRFSKGPRVLLLPIAQGKLAYIAARGCLTIDRMLFNALRPSSRALLRALSPDLISLESLCFLFFLSLSLSFSSPPVSCVHTLDVVEKVRGRVMFHVYVSDMIVES